MKRIVSYIVGFLFFASAGVAVGAPILEYRRTILPETTNTYDLGSTLKQWLTGYFSTICLSGDCKSAWPTGGGGGSSIGWTWNSINLLRTTTTTDDVLIGGTATTTNAKLEVRGGIFANASSTIGDGTPTTGLTVNGGATTTGNAYISGTLGVGIIGTTYPFEVYTTTTNIPARISNASLTGGTSAGLQFASGDSGGFQNRVLLLGSSQNGLSNTGMYQMQLRSGGSFILQNQISTTTSFNLFGNNGFGSSSPYAKLSIHANPNDAVVNQILFAIGSSTPSSTSTLFSIDNTGSTSASNGFDISGGCYAVNGTCLTTGGGGGSAYPFTPSTNFGATQQATTGIMWFQNGLYASSSIISVGTTTIYSTDGTGSTTISANNGTSTFGGGGINLTNGGCFAINGTCFTGGGGTTYTGTYPIDVTGSVISTVATSSLNLLVGSFLSPNISQWTNDSGYITSASLPTYDFPITGNATSSLTQFNGGLTAFASTTIGSGTQAGGLTINGGATTTGNTIVSGNLAVGRSTVSSGFSIDSNGGIVLENSSPLQFNGSSQQKIKLGSTLSALQVTGWNGATDAVLFTISNGNTSNGTTGNVGIGTTSPYSMLSVAGQVVAQNYVATSTTAVTSLQQTTMTNATATNATTTSLGISGIISSILKTTSTGGVVPATNGTDYTLITPQTCSAGQHFNQATAGGVFTCTADTGSASSGNVSTSSTEVSGNLAYWTTNGGTPAKLGTVATTTVTCTGGTTCTSFVAIGSSPVTINSSTGGSAYPFTPLTTFNTLTSATTSALWIQNNLYASGTINSVGTTTIWNALGTASTTISANNGTSTFAGGGINLTAGGCIAINGTCVINGVAFSASTTLLSDFNTWSGWNTFVRSTTTYATSTYLAVTGSGTSTFANGINLTTGCFAVGGTCLSTGGGGSGASTTLLTDNNTFSGITTFVSDIFSSVINIFRTTGNTLLSIVADSQQVLWVTSTSTDVTGVSARVSIGLSSSTPMSTLDHLEVDGRYNNGDNALYECVGFGNYNSATNIVTNVSNTVSSVTTGTPCGPYSWIEDAAGQVGFFATQGHSYLRLSAGATGVTTAIGDGMAMRFNTAWLASGTNTPVMQVHARPNTANASSSVYLIGFSTSTGVTAGATIQTQDSKVAGCYFIASSTLPNWQAVCATPNYAAVTQVDTGIASSTKIGGSGQWREFRIELNSTVAYFYIETVGSASGFQRVATITTNIPTTSSLNPTISVGKASAGLSPSIDVGGYFRTWAQLALPSF